jgi:hypothetical protein
MQIGGCRAIQPSICPSAEAGVSSASYIPLGVSDSHWSVVEENGQCLRYQLISSIFGISKVDVEYHKNILYRLAVLKPYLSSMLYCCCISRNAGLVPTYKAEYHIISMHAKCPIC